MPAKGARIEREHAQLGHRAGSRAPARARLLRHDRALGQPRRVAARARRRRAARAGAVAAAGGRSRSLVGGLSGNLDARGRGRDRRRRARAGDGAPARAARPPRLLPRHRDQRRAVPRLGGLRADRDRDRGRGALGRAARLRGAQWLWTLVFGAIAAVLALPARSASSAGSCSASSSGPCSRRWSTSPGGRSTAPTSARSGTARARAARSGSRSTSSSRSPSRGSRSSPTTRASRATGAAPSSASRSATSSPSRLDVPARRRPRPRPRASTTPPSLPTAVAAAGLASALALLAVTVDETDEAFANVYSAGVSLQNAATRRPAATARHGRRGGRPRSARW